MGVVLDLYKKGVYCETPYKSIYEINISDMKKNIFPLSSYKNKVLLIININSLSNNSKETLDKVELINKISSDYSNSSLEILLFPTNSIDKSELTNDEIIKNINSIGLNTNTDNLKILNRVSIDGEDICEIYKYLLRRSKLFRIREGKAKSIKKNFSFFVVDKNGEVKNFFDEEEDLKYEKMKDYFDEKLIEKASILKEDLQLRTDYIKLGKFI